jgi:hypothetical protein
MEIQRVIKESLFKNFTVRAKVKTYPKYYIDLEKEIFVEAVKGIKKLIERSQDLATSTGVDLSGFEEGYYTIISNLFKLRFAKHQITLIENFLDKVDDEPATVTITKKGKQIEYPFNTEEELYAILLELE